MARVVRAEEPAAVNVRGEREELGSTHIPRAETRLVPGAFGDPFRAIEALPGVAPVTSGLPYFLVRGAPPGNVGYYIDGIRVPMLFHVGAGPSIMAPGLVDHVDLFASAYPTAYGRHVGGIIAGETTAPRRVARGEAQARLFDAGAIGERPFDHGDGSVLVGGRYGYAGLLLSKVAPDYALAYGDYQARVSHTAGDHATVSAFVFGAYDGLENRAMGKRLFDVEFHRLDLRVDHESETTRGRVAVTLGFDRSSSADEHAEGPGNAVSARSLRVRADVTHTLGAGLRVRAGGDLGVERFNVDRVQIDDEVHEFGRHTDPYGGAWVDMLMRLSRDVQLVPGVRLDVSSTRRDTRISPQPRLAARYRLTDRLFYVSAIGLVYQVPTSAVFAPGKDLIALGAGVQEAYQTTQSINAILPWSLSARVTGFASVTRDPGNGVVARSYGGEIFVRRALNERVGWMISYTLARTEAPSTPLGLSEFDRTHVASSVLSVDLGRGFRVGTRAFYESGRPYVALPSTERKRMPGFGRLDARVEKRWTFAGGPWIAATVEWFNATLSTEPDRYEWSAVHGGTVKYLSALTIPSIGLEGGY